MVQKAYIRLLRLVGLLTHINAISLVAINLSLHFCLQAGAFMFASRNIYAQISEIYTEISPISHRSFWRLTRG